jgi:hypothetical protein
MKKNILELIQFDKNSFKDLLSVCIGKAHSNQLELAEYIGEYGRWNTDVTQGKLILGNNKTFDVEYIATTSTSDGMWFSAELERQIPDDYIQLAIQVKIVMQNNNIPYEAKIKLDDSVGITGANLAYINCTLCQENVVYFNGSGNVSIFMFVKKLPDKIFEQVNANKFTTRVTELISNNDLNHKLMIESFLLNNDCKIEKEENKLVGIFNNGSAIEFSFAGNSLENMKAKILP